MGGKENILGSIFFLSFLLAPDENGSPLNQPPSACSSFKLCSHISWELHGGLYFLSLHVAADDGFFQEFVLADILDCPLML